MRVIVEDMQTQDIYNLQTNIDKDQAARLEKLIEMKKYEIADLPPRKELKPAEVEGEPDQEVVKHFLKVTTGGHEFELEKQHVEIKDKIEKVLRMQKKQGNLINRDDTLFINYLARFQSDSNR